MNTIKDLACDELREDLNNLRDLELGSKEYEVAVEGITKLMAKVIETEKFESEAKREAENQEKDRALKQKQMKQERIDRWIGFAVTLIGIGVPAAVTIWGSNKSWAFEKDDTVVSTPGKKFMDRLFSRK